MATLTLRCPVCLEDPLVEPFVSSCGHSICAVCRETLKISRCPECRAGKVLYKPNFMLRQHLEQTVPNYAQIRDKALYQTTVEAALESMQAHWGLTTLTNSTYSREVQLALFRKLAQLPPPHSAGAVAKYINPAQPPIVLVCTPGCSFYWPTPKHVARFLSGNNTVVIMSTKANPLSSP